MMLRLIAYCILHIALSRYLSSAENFFLNMDCGEECFRVTTDVVRNFRSNCYQKRQVSTQYIVLSVNEWRIKKGH